MVAAIQILSKVLESKDLSIIQDNLLTREFFTGYEDEYDFILEHYNTYQNVPDKATFLDKFTDVELVEVTESDEYLVNTIREENLYYQSIPVVKKIAELLKTDANAAVEYMHTACQSLFPEYYIKNIDIVKKEFERHRESQTQAFLTTGFPELDDITGGFHRGEELVVLVARINEGKSWILQKMATHMWEIGCNVGYFSPEMSATSIGYRFDTLHGHFSNTALFRGTDGVDDSEYEQYMKKLHSSTNDFLVCTPKDFKRTVTVTKLRHWILMRKLDALFIDGITYLSDERSSRGDTTDIQLTHISEDLMELSCELQLPIIIVSQANRLSVSQDPLSDNTPGLEHVRYSDGIGANASQVIALKQQRETHRLIMEPKKGRNSALGKKLAYEWDIDHGIFTFIENLENREQQGDFKKHSNKKGKQNKPTDVF